MVVANSVAMDCHDCTSARIYAHRLNKINAYKFVKGFKLLSKCLFECYSLVVVDVPEDDISAMSVEEFDGGPSDAACTTCPQLAETLFNWKRALYL